MNTDKNWLFLCPRNKMKYFVEFWFSPRTQTAHRGLDYGSLTLVPSPSTSSDRLCRRISATTHPNGLFRVFHSPRFPNDRNLDLAGVGEFALYFLGDVAAEQDDIGVGNGIALDDNSQLPAGLDRICFADAVERTRNPLEVFQAPHICFEEFFSSPRPCA